MHHQLIRRRILLPLIGHRTGRETRQRTQTGGSGLACRGYPGQERTGGIGADGDAADVRNVEGLADDPAAVGFDHGDAAIDVVDLDIAQPMGRLCIGTMPRMSMMPATGFHACLATQ